MQQGTGRDAFWAFHPNALPPKPALHIDAATQGLLDQANQALGRLDGVTLLLPDPDQFLYTFIRKEAVLSSQIEGAQSSLSEPASRAFGRPWQSSRAGSAPTSRSLPG